MRENVLKVVMFMIVCDPTGVFVYGDVGVFPFRISPLEIAMVPLFVSLLLRIKQLPVLLPRAWLAFAVLGGMVLFNALRGFKEFGITSLNTSRAELGLLLIPLMPMTIKKESDLRKLATVTTVGIGTNIVAELLLHMQILPIEYIRWGGMRENLPLYDTPMMLASFLFLAIVVHRYQGRPLSMGWKFLALALLGTIIMALTRAVWAGILVAVWLLAFRFLDWRRVRRMMPRVIVLGFLAYVVASNYRMVFGFTEEHGVISGKLETMFDVSRDRDLLFRVLTGFAVLEDVTGNVGTFIAGLPHGSTFVYFDERGKAGDVIIHNAYLLFLVQAGVLGLLSVIVLQLHSLRLTMGAAKKSSGYLQTVSLAVFACLAAMSTNMSFNPNSNERQYIFASLIGLSFVVSRLVDMERTAVASDIQKKTTNLVE